MWGLPTLWRMLYPAGTASVLWQRWNYRCCVKCKEAKVDLAKQAPERGRKSVATGQPNSKAQRAGPYVEQMVPGEGWNHVAWGGILSKPLPLHSTPNPNPSPQSATEAPEQPIGTATRKTSRHEKPQTKHSAALTRLLGNPRRKQRRMSKLRPPNTHHPAWWLPHNSPTPHSWKSLIFLITFPSKHVWSWLAGSSRQSPQMSRSPAGCPKDHYSVCGQIWQHTLGGQIGVKPGASPNSVRTECAAGNLNWSIFSTSRVSMFVS